MTGFEIPGVPFPLVAEGPAADVRPQLSPAGVTLAAAAGADLFLDPADGASPPDAERFVAPVAGDFRLWARVSVDFRATYDSGVLLGWFDGANWFKLCAERDPAGVPRVVTVVTRGGASDDANHAPIPGGNDVHLRISRLGEAVALHSSADGTTWELARYFHPGVPASRPLSVGFLAQSPTGPGTTASFTAAGFDTVRLTDVRDGS